MRPFFYAAVFGVPEGRTEAIPVLRLGLNVGLDEVDRLLHGAEIFLRDLR